MENAKTFLKMVNTQKQMNAIFSVIYQSIDKMEIGGVEGTAEDLIEQVKTWLKYSKNNEDKKDDLPTEKIEKLKTYLPIIAELVESQKIVDSFYKTLNDEQRLLFGDLL